LAAFVLDGSRREATAQDRARIVFDCQMLIASIPNIKVTIPNTADKTA